MRVLVTEPLSERGLGLLRKDFQVDVRPELARGDLALEIGPYDALIVRSQTKVTADVIEAYLAYKRLHEVDELRMRPHPYEFVLYYDV